MIKLYPSRFDFMAKYLYVKQYDKKYNTSFFIDLYKAHITTFNGGYELPDTTLPNSTIIKQNIDDFIKVFNELIDDMKKNGYNKQYPIPVDKNGIIENGTHRLLTAYYYNIKPEIKQISGKGQYYDYNFFLQRQGKPPLERIYADTMALEYINHNPNQRCMILYPNAYDNNKIQKIIPIIKQYGDIYYHKVIKLSPNGLINLIKELYRGEEWIGGLFPTSGGDGKFRFCYVDNPIIYISISMYDVTKLIEMKEKCREIYNLGKHSLHVSDYISDTWRISAALLNENSINFLNNGTNNISPQTKQLLTTYFKEIENNNESNNEDYCLTSSLIMEMYNLRQAKDIDYLHKDNKCIDAENIGIHDGKWLSYYQIHKDEIIYNPQNHFYVNGYKFATLNIIKKMKENRGEPKDINDLELIHKIRI